MMVVILGIMLGSAVQSWTMIMQREREEELLFRGCQIRDAIARWYKPTPWPATDFPRPLMDLKYLLEDPTSPEKVRYLRRLYKDPITNKDFVPIIAGHTWRSSANSRGSSGSQVPVRLPPSRRATSRMT